jgi:hypothetical protein
MQTRLRETDLWVPGSLYPWLEGLLLLKGAARITTFDYNKISSNHPQIETILPSDLAARCTDNSAL